MWRVYGGGSGDEGPTPEQIERWARRMSPPENEFPAGVGATLLLARTEDVAVGLTQMEAFSTGFRFTLTVRLRRPRPDLARGGLSVLIRADSYPGVEIPVENRLLLGLEYPDGRRVSNLTDPHSAGPGADVDDHLVLVPQGGGGGDRNVEQAFWVASLPAGGPVTVVLAWAAMGLPESRTVIDGDAITAAAGRSQVLWPMQPVEAPLEPPPPPRPSAGWFAQPPS
jgi:hypothetical protein